MRVLVIGATGCIGRAVVHALRSRGQTVIAASRSARGDAPAVMRMDFAQAVAPEVWAAQLMSAGIDAVVNCAGILMESRTQRFDRVHAKGPIDLFRGAALAGVQRVAQVSALGVSDEPGLPPYITSKREADRALAALPLRHAIFRPSLVYGPGSASASLFATLAGLPAIALPGDGAQRVQPIHVFEVAESIARWIERDAPRSGVYELAGPRAMSYRAMLESFRCAQSLGAALWLPMPMALMRAAAFVAEALPQKVFSRDSLRLLERNSTSMHNAAPQLLCRAPSPLAVGLRVTPPAPLLDLRVQISPAASWMLRLSVAAMWLYTAFISAWLPHESGVLNLLARCGFSGNAGVAVLVVSCTLNALLGATTLLYPRPLGYALQIGAVVGYTLTAAWHMPELTIDHCGPLAKNVPLMAMLILLWLAAPADAKLRTTSSVPNGERANARQGATQSAALR